MRFADLASGNEPVVKALRGMVDHGKVPHAIMLHENDGGGALPLAVAFLQYLFCSSRVDGDSCGTCAQCNKLGKFIHPDVHIIFPVVVPSNSKSETSPSEPYLGDFRALATRNPSFTESELYAALGFEGKKPIISVAEANSLLRGMSLHSLEGGYSVALIYLPELINTAASNKLLKLLEEPPAQTLFLLVTHSPEKLLPTIVSRCQMFRVASPSMSAASAYDDGGMLSNLMDALLARDLYAALGEAEQIAALPSRESAKGFCRYAADKFRRVFLLQQGLGRLCPEDADAARWASALNPHFARKALDVLDRTMVRIDRNVNMKILFTDLVDRLYINI